MVFVDSIQYASDIHLEHNKNVGPTIIVPRSKYLALVGDIGDPFDKLYLVFLWDMSRKFDTVFLIAGNHEFYNRTVPDTKEKIKEIIAKFPNVFFLDDDVMEFDNVFILGTTLWSDINIETSKCINDYVVIQKNPGVCITRDDTVQTHKTAVSFIDSHVHNHPSKPLIVLSHHGPHPVMNGKFQGNKNESGFTTDLSHLFKKPLICWISGHTHTNTRTSMKGVTLLSNCYGYNTNEQEHYDTQAVYRVPEV